MRIHIDFVVPPRVKRLLKIGAPLAVVLAGSVVYANVPNTFKDGDLLSAQPMNDNFTALDTRLTKLEALAAQETADGGYSVGAVYCGATASTTKGDMSGLSVAGTSRTKARTACQATCASPSAHMCTGLELDRSAELAMTTASGWFASGTSGTSTAPYYECRGWSSALSTEAGPAWSNSTGTYGAPSVDTCDKLYSVLCCN